MNRTPSRYPILYRSKASGSLSWMMYWAASRIGNALRPRRTQNVEPRPAATRPAPAKRPRTTEAEGMRWQSSALATA